jgi:nucleotidyltransferase/DNA polymerase involved in DNA repair
VAVLPIVKFHGVGPKTAAKLHALGIEIGADLRRQTLELLRARSAKPAIGTLRSRVAEPIARFNLTENESLRGWKRPSQRI